MNAFDTLPLRLIPWFASVSGPLSPLVDGGKNLNIPHAIPSGLLIDEQKYNGDVSLFRH